MTSRLALITCLLLCGCADKGGLRVNPVVPPEQRKAEIMAARKAQLETELGKVNTVLGIRVEAEPLEKSIG